MVDFPDTCYIIIDSSPMRRLCHRAVSMVKQCVDRPQGNHTTLIERNKRGHEIDSRRLARRAKLTCIPRANKWSSSSPCEVEDLLSNSPKDVAFPGD